MSGILDSTAAAVAIVLAALFISAPGVPGVSHIPRSAAISCVTRSKSNHKTARGDLQVGEDMHGSSEMKSLSEIALSSCSGSRTIYGSESTKRAFGPFRPLETWHGYFSIPLVS